LTISFNGKENHRFRDNRLPEQLSMTRQPPEKQAFLKYIKVKKKWMKKGKALSLRRKQAS
jgi:hypothetical protein